METVKLNDVSMNVDSKERFLIDLEFVQNLSNPRFLHHLAIQGFLDDPQFLEYLKYLRYWKTPNYVHFLLFPQCLIFLDAIIDNEHFRRELALKEFMEFMHHQQGISWMMGSSWMSSQS